MARSRGGVGETAPVRTAERTRPREKATGFEGGLAAGGTPAVSTGDHNRSSCTSHRKPGLAASRQRFDRRAIPPARRAVAASRASHEPPRQCSPQGDSHANCFPEGNRCARQRQAGGKHGCRARAAAHLPSVGSPLATAPVTCRTPAQPSCANAPSDCASAPDELLAARIPAPEICHAMLSTLAGSPGQAVRSSVVK